MTDQQPRLGLAGQSGWPRMKAPETEVAGQLRQFLLSGKVASTTVTDGANRDRQVLGLVGARFPKALAAFGRPALLALTRTLGPGACSWCAASLIAAGDHEPAPSLDSAPHRALLGSSCRRCAGRHERTKVAAREASHLDQVVAAGLRPQAAARLRTAEQVQRHAAGIQRLKENPPPPAPTGVLWTGGGEPAEVTRALTAALAAADRRPVPNPPPSIRHRAPDPPWYRRRPIRWLEP